MNFEKYTQKSAEAVQAALNIAVRNSNPTIEQAHVLSALLSQEAGLIPQIFTKMTVDVGDLNRRVDRIIGQLPKVSGGGQQYMSSELNKALVAAEDIAEDLSAFCDDLRHFGREGIHFFCFLGDGELALEFEVHHGKIDSFMRK